MAVKSYKADACKKKKRNNNVASYEAHTCHYYHLRDNILYRGIIIIIKQNLIIMLLL